MSDDKTFEAERPPVLDTFLRQWLKRALDVSGLKREDLCVELTKRLDRQISLFMLSTWVGDSKRDWHIPADALPVLCEVLRDDTPLRQLLSPERREALELGESGARLCSLLEKRIGKYRKQTKKVRR